MAREAISGIYKIELKDEFKELSSGNGIYIGQSIDIYRRWEEHRYKSKRYFDYQTILYNAMNKYGIENFYFEIIEKCKHSKLNKREVYWVDYYDSFENGYNMNIGGFVGCRGEQNGNAYITQEIADDIRVYYKNNYVNYQDVADHFDTTRPVVNKVLSGMSYMESDFAKNYIKPKEKRITIPTEDNCRALLTQIKADEIREFYKNNINKTQVDLCNKYNLSKKVINDILNKNTYLNSEYSKNYNVEPRSCNVLTQKYADRIRREYKNTDISIIKLSDKHNISEGLAHNILKGRSYMDSEYAKNYKS